MRAIAWIAAVLLAGACSGDGAPGQGAEPTDPTGEARTAPAGSDEAADLGGTSWHLVSIASMDDNEYVPDDPSLYTLQFSADGAAAIRADCNRGSGTWTSESPGQLQFGPIAGTVAECGPDSLYDRYMSQFEWIRSYVMRDGHLFLATMADGAIIEFEPADGGDGS